MEWIAMPNENGTKSLVHYDLCDYYLAHNGIKVQKLGVIRSRNKASYSLTNHGAKVATNKADKAHTKYVQEAKKAAEYARSLAEKVDKRKDKK